MRAARIQDPVIKITQYTPGAAMPREDRSGENDDCNKGGTVQTKLRPGTSYYVPWAKVAKPKGNGY